MKSFWNNNSTISAWPTRIEHEQVCLKSSDQLRMKNLKTFNDDEYADNEICNNFFPSNSFKLIWLIIVRSVDKNEKQSTSSLMIKYGNQLIGKTVSNSLTVCFKYILFNIWDSWTISRWIRYSRNRVE